MKEKSILLVESLHGESGVNNYRDQGYLIKNLLNGDIIINSSNIDDYVTNIIYNNSGNIEISGDTKINTGDDGIYNNTGNVKITGAKIKCSNGTTIENNGKQGNITIGKKDGVINYDDIIIKSTNNYAIKNNGVFNFYDGTIIAQARAISGRIDDIEDNYEIITEIKKDEENKSNYPVYDEYIKLNANPSYEYNGKEYLNLENAINNIPQNNDSESLIKLKQSIIDISSINISNKNIILDLNGNSIQFTKSINIDALSKFKITDSKKTSTSSNNISFATTENEKTNGVDNHGYFEIKDVDIIAVLKSSSCILNEENAKAIINNSKITNKRITTEDYKISTLNYCFTENMGNLEINNSKILFNTLDNYYDELLITKNNGKGITNFNKIDICCDNHTYNHDIKTTWKILNQSGIIKINGLYSTEDQYIKDKTILENQDGEIDFNDGNFCGIVNNQKSGNIVVNGGTLKKINNNLDGKVTILNGTVDSSNYYANAIYNNIGTIEIGSKDGNVTDTPILRGKQNAIQNDAGKVNYYDGKLIGESSPIIGELTEIENECGTETTYDATNKYNVIKLIKKEVAEIGDTKYYSLYKAIENAKDDDIIKLISNGSELKAITINKKVNIDLNDFEIDLRKGVVINKEAELDVTDSSNLKNGAINLFYTGSTTEYQKSIENNGTMKIKNATINDYGQYSYQIYNSGESNLIIENSKIIGKFKNTYQIYNTSKNEVKILESKISREYKDNSNANSSYMIYNNNGKISLLNATVHSEEDTLGDCYKKKIELIHNESGEINIDGGEYTYSGGGSNYSFRIIYNNLNGKILCKNAKFEDSGKKDNIPYSAFITIVLNYGDYSMENSNIIYNGDELSDEDFLPIENHGNFNFTNSSISSNLPSVTQYNSAIEIYGGNTYINSGKIDGYGRAITKQENGKLYIGNKGGEIQTKSPIIKGINYGISNFAWSSVNPKNVYFYDGMISGKSRANTGEFTEIEPNYQLYTSMDSDGYTNVSLKPVGGAVNVASIGSVNYASLQDAIASCTTGGESIVLTRDIELDDSTIEIDSIKNIMINLNGHKISSSSTDGTLINNGVLTIKDSSQDGSGSITNKNGPAIVNNSTLNLGLSSEDKINKSPTIEGTSFGIENTTLKGILNMYNGEIAGEKAVDGNPINEIKEGYILTKSTENNKEIITLIKQ